MSNPKNLLFQSLNWSHINIKIKSSQLLAQKRKFKEKEFNIRFECQTFSFQIWLQRNFQIISIWDSQQLVYQNFAKKKNPNFFFKADKNSVYVNTSKKFLSIICLQLLYWIFQLLRHSNYQRRMVDYSCNHIERDLFAVQL